MSHFGLPPTVVEETIERQVLSITEEIHGQNLTVRQKRKVENLTISLRCICEKDFPIGWMYKCLYCEAWLCKTCAEEHFGQTVEGYKQEKAQQNGGTDE